MKSGETERAQGGGAAVGFDSEVAAPTRRRRRMRGFVRKLDGGAFVGERKERPAGEEGGSPESWMERRPSTERRRKLVYLNS